MLSHHHGEQIEEEGEEETGKRKRCDPNPSGEDEEECGEWETMARAWLSSFPEAKAGSVQEVEAWIDSNRASLPPDLRSMPRSQLCHRLVSIHDLMRFSSQDSQLPESERCPLKAHKDVLMKPALPIRYSFIDLPKHSDLYLEKRKEEFRKYEILVELEKLLAPIFSKSQGLK